MGSEELMQPNSAESDADGIRSTASEMVLSAPNRRERAELLEVLAEAFLDNPMNVAIHGGARSRRLRANLAGLRPLVLRPKGAAALRVGRVDGRIRGGFVAVRPHEYPLGNTGIRDQIGCVIHQGWRAMTRWEHAYRTMAPSHPIHPHWYLAVLGVSPSHWGRGLGSELLRELEALVAEEPAPIYLESDRADSVAFYRRRGFSIRAEHEVFGVRCTCLERSVPFPSRGD